MKILYRLFLNFARDNLKISAKYQQKVEKNSDPCVQKLNISVFELLKCIVFNFKSYSFKQAVVEIKIAHYAKAHCERLFAFKKMSDK